MIFIVEILEIKKESLIKNSLMRSSLTRRKSYQQRQERICLRFAVFLFFLVFFLAILFLIV